MRSYYLTVGTVKSFSVPLVVVEVHSKCSWKYYRITTIIAHYITQTASHIQLIKIRLNRLNLKYWKLEEYTQYNFKCIIIFVWRKHQTNIDNYWHFSWLGSIWLGILQYKIPITYILHSLINILIQLDWF